MKLTLEEMERKAYISGNKKLSDFLGIVLEGDAYVEEFKDADQTYTAFIFEDSDSFEDFQCN